MKTGISSNLGDSSQSRHRPFPKMMPKRGPKGPLGALAFPRRWTFAKKFFESVMNTSVGTGRSDGTLWCQCVPSGSWHSYWFGDFQLIYLFTYSKGFFLFLVAMLVYQRVVILKEKREDIITFNPHAAIVWDNFTCLDKCWSRFFTWRTGNDGNWIGVTG